jgi:succinate dehydrogenase (ubiquinone) cytochrome b560 subunit
MSWIPSSLNRITGVMLSGGFYLYAIAYLVAPTIGWHLDSHTLAASFAAWPVMLKVLGKFVVAMPFTFHSFNGIRHLMWDTGTAFTNKQVITTAWIAIGVSMATAVGLTFY